MINYSKLKPNVEKALKALKENPDLQPIRNPPLRKVKAIQFGILGPEEIRGISVCKLTKSKISQPLTETVYDERMGPSTSSGLCATCGCNIKICPGHFGHIDLEKPIFHSTFIRIIISILNCICMECSHIRLSEKELELELKSSQIPDRELFLSERLKKIEKLCSKIVICRHCNSPTAEFSLVENDIYVTYSKSKNNNVIKQKKDRVSPEELIPIFKAVSEEDLQLMGFCVKYREIYRNGILKDKIPSFRPEWLIRETIPALPIVARPPNWDGTGKTDDDLTTTTTEIIKYNEQLKDAGPKKNNREKTNEDFYNKLRLYISGFIDNTDQKVKHSSGKPIKSIKERLSSKNGHVRGKLMGKRVDCSARTVITADATLELDQVGVPIEIATNLSYPEKIIARNYLEMESLLKNGHINMINRTGEIYMGVRLAAMTLKLGDIVYRHLTDNDISVFNRQPTLHRGSMMGHRNVNLPAKTFRLNLSVCKPYNADFDGDEMQLHVPQDYETVAEVKEIMSVVKNIVSGQSSKPIMGVVQDALIASYLLTQVGKTIKKHQFMDCLFSASRKYLDNIDNLFFRAKKFYTKLKISNKEYPARLLFSAILPSDFCYTKKTDLKKFEYTITKSDSAEKISKLTDTPINIITDLIKDKKPGDKIQPPNVIVIQNGILVFGILTSQILGSVYDSIAHRLFKYYSPQHAADFLSHIQFINNRYLIYHGFSVGVSDFIIDNEEKQSIKDSIQKGYIEVQSIQNSSETDLLKEFKINNCLNTRGQKLSITSLKSGVNRLLTMVDCGSKGNRMNINQIIGHLGQNNVEGKRIQPEIDFSQRTLPCFKRGDISPQTRGFIENSFLGGLSPEEFFFHAKAGREGIINTAVKTRDSGYSERKLVKRLEGLIVQQDLTVRDTLGSIVSFLSGGDALEPQYIVNNSFIDLQVVVNQLNNEIDD